MIAGPVGFEPMVSESALQLRRLTP